MVQKEKEIKANTKFLKQEVHLHREKLLNTVIVSFYSRKFNDNSTKMMQFPHFSLPFLTISRI